MVFKFLEKVKDILTICLLSPAFAVQIYTNHTKMQQYNKDIQFYWCYIFLNCILTKSYTNQKVRNTHNRIRPIASSLFPRPWHHSFFFSETPVSVQLVDRRKRDTMGNDYMPMT